MPFITDEVKAKRAVSIEETNEKLKTLRRNEVSRFFKEGILALCQEVRNAAIGEYMITGKLPDEIRIYDRDLLITSAVANNLECRKALLKELQSLEEEVRDVEFRYTGPSYSWGITSDPYIVVYFSNNQE